MHRVTIFTRWSQIPLPPPGSPFPATIDDQGLRRPYLGGVRVQIGVDDETLHPSHPEAEVIVAKVLLERPEGGRRGSVAHVVISADTQEGDGGVDLAKNGLSDGEGGREGEEGGRERFLQGRKGWYLEVGYLSVSNGRVRMGVHAREVVNEVPAYDGELGRWGQIIEFLHRHATENFFFLPACVVVDGAQLRVS